MKPKTYTLNRLETELNGPNLGDPGGRLNLRRALWLHLSVSVSSNVTVYGLSKLVALLLSK